MVIFLGITEIITFGWIGYELRKTLYSDNSLINNEMKYKLYKSLSIFLLVVGSISIIVAIAEITITETSNLNNTWRFIWMFAVYWELLYLCSISFMCWIWQPSPNNTRYTYGDSFLLSSTEEESTKQIELEHFKDESSVEIEKDNL